MDRGPTGATGERCALRAAKRAFGSFRARSPFAVALAVWLGSMLHSLPARSESEQVVKAAFLFNFARYVEWREGVFASDSAPIRLCVAGSGEFEGVLSGTVGGRAVGKRAVEVDSITALDQVEGCHLLFFDARSGFDAGAVVTALADRSVFTIADEPGFALGGGIANFIVVDQKVRFEINPAAARRAKLKISSSLLRLAKLVGDDAR